MSKYTITIRQLQKNNFNFGLQDYPIFDENYRETLNNNILNYYYESEIGFETAELFKKILNDRMTLILPKYNDLYLIQKQLLENGALNSVNLRETMDRDTTGSLSQNDSGNATQTGSSSSDNKNIYQDTPQGSISTQVIDQQSVYATNVTIDKNSNSSTVQDYSTSSRSQSSEGTDNYIKTIIGNNGKKSNIELYKSVIANLKNIDMLIINDLSDLFMGIF